MQNAIINCLTANDYAVIRINSLAAHTATGAYVSSYIAYPHKITKGAADLLVFYGRRCAFVEVKYGRGKQSKEQIKFAQWCSEQRIPYTAATTVEEALVFVDLHLYFPATHKTNKQINKQKQKQQEQQ